MLIVVGFSLLAATMQSTIAAPDLSGAPCPSEQFAEVCVDPSAPLRTAKAPAETQTKCLGPFLHSEGVPLSSTGNHIHGGERAAHWHDTVPEHPRKPPRA